MTLKEFEDGLSYDRRTRGEWSDREWTDHCIKVSKEIDNDEDREMIIKMINLGWDIIVH